MASAHTKHLVPKNFVVPAVLEHKQCRIRTLTVNDVIKDYDAVISRREHLQGVFGSNSNWPAVDLTLQQNLIDFSCHQKEFQIKRSFAYTVVTLDEKHVIGCIYIYSTDKGEFDAEITMWVSQDALKDGYDVIFLKTVEEWLANE
ncbi:MAG: hypothetical protein ACI9T9_002893 [Oleiphilaceae bacterium]|jgi:hypothetical protein